jgi:YVTN family beta-propeller protein
MVSTMARWATTCALALYASLSVAHAAEPLSLEIKIPLGKVAGRIDHLAIDLARQRLFVAELGNSSVGVVDLNERKVTRTISGLSRPQGVGYHQPTDTLYVANAGDGSVRLFRGPDYSVAGRIDLDDDADNVRLDAAANRIIVGYGNGALAVIDPENRSKIADIPNQGAP